MKFSDIILAFKGITVFALVGPSGTGKSFRAKLVAEKYGIDAEKLLSVKPGMIGWWAANGRSNISYASGKRQEYELYYVDHCSVWLDIKIIFKTIFGVFKRTGAQ